MLQQMSDFDSTRFNHGFYTFGEFGLWILPKMGLFHNPGVGNIILNCVSNLSCVVIFNFFLFRFIFLGEAVPRSFSIWTVAGTAACMFYIILSKKRGGEEGTEHRLNMVDIIPIT